MKAVPMDFDTWNSLCSVLYEEAASLDEQRWDDWLSLYTDDCVYWVQAWNGEHELANNPENEVSLMYMDNKTMLEDRMWRFTSGASPASTPLPRTNHLVGNISLVELSTDKAVLKSHWQVASYRFRELTQIAGRSCYTLRLENGQWKIAHRQTVIVNDQVQTTLDLYHI
ncbi:MAG: aromatic-ring-hydroxylating dioxygenase subunit beta [Cycloclasticus sp.]|nr:aromatic-ring-hydroxylating dioxygenase subunit beta [Cycloclasticus sp.]